MQKHDHQQDFSGESPPSEGIRDNKFDGESNPDQGEQKDMSPSFAPNMFPREGGSDSYSGLPGDGIVPG